MPISLKIPLFRRTSTVIATSFLLGAVVLLTACGDTYRPVAIPIPKPGGDPLATHYAVVLNTNNGNPGDPTATPPVPGPAASQIDVGGDTNTGNHPTGLGPVHAAISSSFQALVVNQGDDTLSSFSMLFSSSVQIAKLDTNSGASFVSFGSGVAAVSETSLNKVAMIDTNQVAVKAFVPVGLSPRPIIASADAKKFYVGNTGDGTITVISTLDNTVSGSPIAVGGSPVSMALSGNGAFLFVANSSGNALSVIDTSVDQELQHLGGLSNPTQVLWEDHLQRVYVLNSNSVSIYNGSSTTLTLLKTVNLPAAPLQMAALDDGSRFYVLYAGSPGTVGVYDAQSFLLRTTVTVQNNPTSIAASPGSGKVFVTNRTGDAGAATPSFPNGSLSIIRTADDTVINITTGVPTPVFVTAR